MGENIWKWNGQQGLVSKTYTWFMQLNIKKKKKKTKLNLKEMGRKSKWKFLQRRHTDSQNTHEKMLKISN